MPRIGSFLVLKLVAATAVVSVLTGCSGGGTANTVPVKGTVKLGGAAVPGAAVTFTPTGAGTVATGITNAQGEFSLQTFVAGDGAIPGEYKVVISKSQVQQSSTTTKSTADDPSAAYAAAEASGANVGGKENFAAPAGSAAATGAGAQDLLPAKYKSVDTTDLTAKVEKGKDNNFPFDLK